MQNVYAFTVLISHFCIISKGCHSKYKFQFLANLSKIARSIGVYVAAFDNSDK